MKTSLAAIFVAAKAAQVEQSYGSYYNQGRYHGGQGYGGADRYAGLYSGYAGRVYDGAGYGHYGEPVAQEYILATPAAPVREQVVPSCPRYCAKAVMGDAWEGQLGHGKFGTDGTVTFEQNCTGKIKINGEIHNYISITT